MGRESRDKKGRKGAWVWFDIQRTSSRKETSSNNLSPFIPIKKNLILMMMMMTTTTTTRTKTMTMTTTTTTTMTTMTDGNDDLLWSQGLDTKPQKPGTHQVI